MELIVFVLMVCKENTMVLKIMNTSAQTFLFVNFGVLMKTVIVLKILMLVKMNGDHYAYLKNLKKNVNVVDNLLANMIMLVTLPVSDIKLLKIRLVIQELQIVLL
jgi:hypothetical protein